MVTLSIPAFGGAALLLLATSATQAQVAVVDSSLSFFITSTSLGKGGDLGGLAGADKHCQDLAQAVGAGTRTWKAYLSTQAASGAAAVNAKDRIGQGPWFNAKKAMVAKDVADLHSPSNHLGKETSLNEKGEVVKGKGDNPNQHDILTGSHADGSAYAAGADMTCSNWTSSTTGKAMLGHHDRHGVAGNIDSTSWNEAHASSGCTQANLVQTGGNGYFYCFASNAQSVGVKSLKPEAGRKVLAKTKRHKSTFKPSRRDAIERGANGRSLNP